MNDFYQNLFRQNKIIGEGPDGFSHPSISGFPEQTPALDEMANVRRLISVVAVGLKEPGLLGYTLGLEREGVVWLAEAYPGLILGDHHIVAPRGMSIGKALGIGEVRVETEGVADLVTFVGQTRAIQLLMKRFIPTRFAICRPGNELNLKGTGLAEIQNAMKCPKQNFQRGGHGPYLNPVSWDSFFEIVGWAKAFFNIRSDRFVFPGMRIREWSEGMFGPEWCADGCLMPVQNICRLAKGIYQLRLRLWRKASTYYRTSGLGYRESDFAWDKWFWKDGIYPYFKIEGSDSSSRERLEGERNLKRWIQAGGLSLDDLEEYLPESKYRSFVGRHRRMLGR